MHLLLLTFPFSFYSVSKSLFPSSTFPPQHILLLFNFSLFSPYSLSFFFFPLSTLFPFSLASRLSHRLLYYPLLLPASISFLNLNKITETCLNRLWQLSVGLSWWCHSSWSRASIEGRRHAVAPTRSKCVVSSRSGATLSRPSSPLPKPPPTNNARAQTFWQAPPCNVVHWGVSTWHQFNVL